MNDFRDFKLPDVSSLTTTGDLLSALIQIRNVLANILHYQERRVFFPVGHPDGSKSFVNLSQAAEIHRVSDEECHIKFVDGGVISVTTKEGVDSVIQAIGKELISIDDLPKAPQLQAQNK